MRLILLHVTVARIDMVIRWVTIPVVKPRQINPAELGPLANERYFSHPKISTGKHHLTLTDGAFLESGIP